MDGLVKRGTMLTTSSSNIQCEVMDLLGGGGQGEVYSARLRGDGNGDLPVAVKWYFPQVATETQKENLRLLVNRGPPDQRFVWPLGLVECDGLAGFGYFMPLRGPGYHGLIDLMKGRVDPGFRALATTCYELSDSFFQLHSRGLCYRDISFGNVFFEPDEGRIQILDNDNVTTNGEGACGVLGTPMFMAPEIVRGESVPSVQTDLWSLGVLMFYLLIVHHPLHGRKESSIKCLDAPAMKKLYGTEALFIFDPKDHSNEPVPGFHDNAIQNWFVLPTFLRDLFERAFTEGLRDPTNGRVRESEWRQAMVQFRDSIFYCACGAENIYDVEDIRTRGGAPGRCWSDNAQLRLPYRLKVGRKVVLLNHDTRIFRHHVDDDHLYDFQTVIGEVVRHPSDANAWGLRNVSKDTWVATRPEGKVNGIAPGQSVTLVTGLKVRFGKTDGEVRY